MTTTVNLYIIDSMFFIVPTWYEGTNISPWKIDERQIVEHKKTLLISTHPIRTIDTNCSNEELGMQVLSAKNDCKHSKIDYKAESYDELLRLAKVTGNQKLEDKAKYMTLGFSRDNIVFNLYQTDSLSFLTFPANEKICRFPISSEKLGELVNIVFNKSSFQKTSIFKRSGDDEKVKQQFCAHCYEFVDYAERYPKYICNTCVRQLTDDKGELVEFYIKELEEFSIQGSYIASNRKKKYDSNVGFIDGKKYKSRSTQFGGIVIQCDEDEEFFF